MERIRSRCASPWVLAFVLVVAVGVLVAPAAATAGTLGGALWDHASIPIEGITVGLYLAGTPPTALDSTVTNSLGQYNFTGLSAGTYWLRYSDPANRYSTIWYHDALRAYAPDTPHDWVVTDSSSDSFLFTLQHGVTLHVHVVRPGLQPVENVQVSAVRLMSIGDPWPWAQLTTDASGECTFTNMPEGQWYATAFDQHPNSSLAWFTSGWYPSSSYVGFAAGESHDETITVSMVPVVTVDVVGGAGWRQSLTGDIAFDLDLHSDYASTGLYRVVPVGGPDPLWWTTWTGSSQRTATITEGAYEIQAYGQTDTSPVDGDPGYGPEVHVQIGIDNTKPHTGSNVGLLVSQPALVLSPDDGALSGIGYTRYSLDGGTEQPYTDGSPVLLTRGVHSVTWYSRDTAGNTEDAHSGTIISGPQAYVRKPVSRSSITHGRYLSVSGTLTRARNHSRLTLIASRWNGAEWVQVRTKAVTVHTPRRGLSRYSGSIKMSSKGSWKVVARYDGDATWVRSYSSPKYVTVR
jgi:hypothetical protein